MVRKNKISACFTILIFSIVFGCKVSALSGSTYIDKAYLEGVYTCWTGHLKSAPITQNDFPVFSINFPNRIFKDNNDGAVLIPRVLSGLDDNDLGCVNLMAGQGSNFSGLVSMSGVTQPANDSVPSTKTTFMENIGYSTEKTTSSTGKCASFNFKANSGNRETRSGSLCLTDLTNDEKITNSTKVEIPKDSGGGNFTLQDSISFKPVDGGVEVSYGVYTQNCTQTNIGSTCSGYVYSKVSKTFKVADYRTFDDFMSGADGIAGQFNKQPPSLCAGYYQLACIDYALDITKSDSIYNSSTIDESMVQYVIEDKTVAANTAIKTFSGSEELKDWASLKYTDAEKAHLYQDYLNKVFEVSFADDSCPSLSDSQIALLKDSGYSPVKWNFSGSGAKVCYIKASEKTANKEVVGIKEDGHFGEKMKFSDLITALESITLTDGEFDDVADSNSDNGKVEPTCMNTAGTSLGWILCPVLDAFGGATDWAYNELVEPALKIEPQLFTGEGDNTRDAWRTFRDIANIFFIILFLVVIFSQLTGVGIDNYGIKKILPKLIVAAVLINLSYIICVVFIDLSNILGNGLRNIFTRLGSQLTIPDSIEGIKIGDVAGGALTAITVLIALVGGVAVAITAAGGVVAFLVSLLVVALSAIIALFFLFLLLAAREAAIVVLTVLSPLAFACYILPNTQNIFKKWYQLGWRLLMVYPIAGLLIGGGDYVSKLLLSAGVGSEGFFSAFTAMIAGIVPIFFIPTVLKQSFALMGGLGAKIAGFGKSMGSRVSGNLDKSVRGGERFKNYQADRERNRKLRYARRTNRNLSDRLDNGETLSQRQRDRLARARMVESAEYSDELKRRAIVDGNRYETMRAGIEAKSRDEAINDRLALMQKNGVNGGAYSLENMYARMQNLEKASRTQALTDDEKGEMAALARGMASRQGGASMLNSIIRSAGSDGKSNSNFMSAMGEIYGNDSAVASKMAEKDAGASAFTEKFMPNGAGYDGDFAAYQGTKEYKDAIDKRIKSYSAGLNQGGAAVTDYVNSLDKSDLQAIIDNEGLYNSLDTDVRRAIDERTGSGPKGLNIQRTARQVEIAGENQVFDVHGLDSDTLLDIATNPKISDNDPNRAAAVEELNKRGIK